MSCDVGEVMESLENELCYNNELCSFSNLSVKPGEPSQSNPLSSPPRWCPWDLFRSFKVCSDAKERVGCRRQREATAPIQSLVKLQPRFLSLWWKTCLRQNCRLSSVIAVKDLPLGRTLMMMMIPEKISIIFHTPEEVLPEVQLVSGVLCNCDAEPSLRL